MLLQSGARAKGRRRNAVYGLEGAGEGSLPRIAAGKCDFRKRNLAADQQKGCFSHSLFAQIRTDRPAVIAMKLARDVNGMARNLTPQTIERDGVRVGVFYDFQPPPDL